MPFHIYGVGIQGHAQFAVENNNHTSCSSLVQFYLCHKIPSVYGALFLAFSPFLKCQPVALALTASVEKVPASLCSALLFCMCIWLQVPWDILNAKSYNRIQQKWRLYFISQFNLFHSIISIRFNYKYMKHWLAWGFLGVPRIELTDFHSLWKYSTTELLS